MRTRAQNPFSTVTTSGLLLPVDLLTRVADGDPDLPGLSPRYYHLRSGERTSEAASRAWNECLAAWQSFKKKFDALPASDAGTTLTRDEWLLHLFQELGYGRLQIKKAIEIDQREYPVSHGWESHVPIHLISARYPLDRRSPGVAGAATRSPYSMVQELLNRSAEHRWGFVSNGRKLYLLRDNAALSRAANVEFDLEAMMDGEVYADFLLLFLVCHQSRLEIPSDGKPEDCWLEKWANQADQQGTRAREKLRVGVEAAIQSLGAGFLTTRGNDDLRRNLRSGDLSTQDYYRQLLRVVYRLLMLLVAEEKKTEAGDNLLHPPDTSADLRERYARFYSVGRLQSLARIRRGTSHTDLYASLKVLFEKLREGYPPLGIPGFGSFLFSATATPELDTANLTNQDLLDAFRHLCFTEDTSGRGGAVRRPVDFGNLGSEELGSVYESLLELHPQIDTDEGPFTLGTAAGHERKTTGSYYTPRSLINCLLDSALDPVVAVAIDVPDPAEAERNLLALKVCDPASGSGHFLIAAAERMAMHLARLRTGDDQPGTLDVQHAKRDIIGRCIYGVDINPMAVELCKVSLWMEALEPGKPLSFLDHHIQCGNSLLGTTPRLLAEGIPDDAFKPIEGDEKKVASNLKKQNKKERKDRERRQGRFEYEPYIRLGNLPGELVRLAGTSENSVADVAEKERHYYELVKGADYQNARLLADTWCAVFVWKKDASDLGKLCPTEDDFRRNEDNPHSILPHVKSEVRRLADQYQFFHWHLAFPDVFRLPGEGKAENKQTGWNNGFDVVLGNPPWERINLKEQEWFAERSPIIAGARTAAARKKLIRELPNTDPSLADEFAIAVRDAEGKSQFIRTSNRFPLCGRGDVNVYAVFAETMMQVSAGMVGCLVPTGIATDDMTKHFFRDIVEKKSLVSLFDFENREALFGGIHRSYRFCLLTLRSGIEVESPPEFIFFAYNVRDLNDSDRRFKLSQKDIALLNPNTRTAPVFRTRKDAEIARNISSRFPVLVEEPETRDDCWGFGYREVIHMSHMSKHFVSPSNTDQADEQLAPVYEAKMIHHFDHRWMTFDPDGRNDNDSLVRSDPNEYIKPRYYIPAAIVEERIRDDWVHKWCVGWRDITNATNERTLVAAILPRVGIGNTISMALISSELAWVLPSCFSSFAIDYCARQRLGGTHLNMRIMRQIPVPPPSKFEANCPWSASGSFQGFLHPRVLELTYTAWDLEAFALDCGYAGPPFRWDEERRFLLRCELDAAYFHLYLGPPGEWGTDSPQLHEMFPTPRDAVDYIMGTFPIVKRKDESKHDGEYKTKTTILKMYDQMTDAIRTGQPYQTWLDPPPGPPTDAEGNFIPVSHWDESVWPLHIHPPREAVRPVVVVDPAFPVTPLDKQLCACLLDLTQLQPGASESDLVNKVVLAMQKDHCRKLLVGEDRDQLDRALEAVPPELVADPDGLPPWPSLLRSQIENGALSSDGGSYSKGERFDEVRGQLPAISEAYVSLVAQAALRMREVSPDDADAAEAAKVVSGQTTALMEG